MSSKALVQTTIQTLESDLRKTATPQAATLAIERVLREAFAQVKNEAERKELFKAFSLELHPDKLEHRQKALHALLSRLNILQAPQQALGSLNNKDGDLRFTSVNNGFNDFVDDSVVGILRLLFFYQEKFSTMLSAYTRYIQPFRFLVNAVSWVINAVLVVVAFSFIDVLYNFTYLITIANFIQKWLLYAVTGGQSAEELENYRAQAKRGTQFFANAEASFLNNKRAEYKVNNFKEAELIYDLDNKQFFDALKQGLTDPKIQEHCRRTYINLLSHLALHRTHGGGVELSFELIIENMIPSADKKEELREILARHREQYGADPSFEEFLEVIIQPSSSEIEGMLNESAAELDQEIIDAIKPHGVVKIKWIAESLFKSIANPLPNSIIGQMAQSVIVKPIQVLATPIFLTTAVTLELALYLNSALIIGVISAAVGVKIATLALLNLPLDVYDAYYRIVQTSQSSKNSQSEPRQEQENDKKRAHSPMHDLGGQKNASAQAAPELNDPGVKATAGKSFFKSSCSGAVHQLEYKANQPQSQAAP